MNVIFFGTPGFASTVLKRIVEDPNINIKAVVTQRDRAAGRGKKITPSPVKELSMSYGIPTLQPANIKTDIDSFLEQLTSFGPFDAGIVVAFGQILPSPVLNFPLSGCINIHASILPRWRGAAPIQRALMAGDAETGISLMKIDEGLDTGQVYCSEKISINQDDNFGTLGDKLADIGASLVIRNLNSIINGSLKPTPQSEVGVTYAKKISNEECEIEWIKSSNEIFNQVRALSPFPGAFTFINGKRLKIFRTRPGIYTGEVRQAGTVVFISKDRLEVSCGNASLSILEVQLEGKGRISIQEFLAGNRLNQGQLLGIQDE